VLIVAALLLQVPAGFTELAASVGLLLVICGGFLCVYEFRGGGGGFWAADLRRAVAVIITAAASADTDRKTENGLPTPDTAL
jgi:hypothetical protein